MQGQMAPTTSSEIGVFPSRFRSTRMRSARSVERSRTTRLWEPSGNGARTTRSGTSAAASTAPGAARGTSSCPCSVVLLRDWRTWASRRRALMPRIFIRRRLVVSERRCCHSEFDTPAPGYAAAMAWPLVHFLPSVAGRARSENAEGEGSAKEKVAHWGRRPAAALHATRASAAARLRLSRDRRRLRGRDAPRRASSKKDGLSAPGSFPRSRILSVGIGRRSDRSFQASHFSRWNPGS